MSLLLLLTGEGEPLTWSPVPAADGSWALQANIADMWTPVALANGSWGLQPSALGSWGEVPPADGDWTGTDRLADALANPTPRTVAAVDPIAAITVATNPLPDTNIASGIDNTLASGKLRGAYGKIRTDFADYVTSLDQFHIDGTTPFYQTTGPLGVEVVTADRYVEFSPKCNGQRFHIFVDGVLTNATGYNVLPNDGAYHNVRLDFGTAATRRVRFLSKGVPFFGPVRSQTALSATAPARRCNMIVVGDSFWEPSFPTYAIGGLPYLLAERLGIDNIVPAASGGTGFVNAAGKANFAQRIVKDLTLAPADDPTFDLIVIAPSGNDVSGNLVPAVYATYAAWAAAYTANVDFVLSTARAAWPDATVVVLDFAVKQNTALADRVFMTGVLEAACAANGCTWAPGVVAGLAALDNATLNSWYDDGGHPNDTGHIGLAGLIDTAIRAALDPWTPA